MSNMVPIRILPTKYNRCIIKIRDFTFFLETIVSGNEEPTQYIALIKHEIYVKKEYVNIKRNHTTLDIGILPMARLSSTLGASFSKLLLPPLKPPNIVALSHLKASFAMAPHQIGVVCLHIAKKTFWYNIKLLRK